MKPLFAAVSFLSAFLLFSVQPMLAKSILAPLGGTPAVWNTSMCFFQTVLLLGYAYAHLLARRGGRAPLFHLAVLAGTLATLPLALPPGWAPPPEANPVWEVLSVLARTVGPAFFLLSATAPLLQAWYARIHSEERASSPYFLYAVSNAGSFLALLAYPFLLEPIFSLSLQRAAWSGGVLFFAILLGWVALFTARAPVAAPSDAPAPEAPRAAVGRWIFLSFVPASLLYGVTTYLTTDIAAIPLLWVIPLALYLATFVVTFASRPILTHELVLRILPHLLLAMGVLFYLGREGLPWILLPLHLFAFTVVALAAHGELARTRPAPAGLTAFYLWLSLGGVLAGVWNALLAPILLPTVLEYPLALLLACAIPPSRSSSRPMFGLAGLLALALWIAARTIDAAPENFRLGFSLVAACGAGASAFALRRDRAAFALALAALLAVGFTRIDETGDLVRIARSYFGVHRVKETADGRFRLLLHGGTVHGGARLAPGRAGEPMGYYHRTGPVGDLFSRLPGHASRRVALIGLGTGALTTFAATGETWTYFEIDPTVERFARADFPFLAAPPAPTRVVLGDARLTLARIPDGSVDLLVLDAFSSDAIPLHLVTREAFALYLRKLAPNGAMALHISNRFLDLRPVIGDLAQDAGLVALHRDDGVVSDALREDGKYPSIWAAAARTPGDLGDLPAASGWTSLPRRGKVWTDDYASIASVFYWRVK